MAGEWVSIGRVRSVQVPKRGLRIAPAPGFADQFADRDWLWVQRIGEPPLRCRVESIRRDGDVVLATLAAGVPRDTVGAMRGAEILLPREALRVERESEWPPPERLVGAEVRLESGEVVGAVTDAFPTGANDVIEVERPGGEEILLPVVADLVKGIDLDAGVITVGDIAPYVVDDAD